MTVEFPDGKRVERRVSTSDESREFRFEEATRGGGYRVELGPPIGSSQLFAVNVDTAASRPERVVVALPALAPGAYMLQYKVLAEDGHASQGAVRFTILPSQ